MPNEFKIEPEYLIIEYVEKNFPDYNQLDIKDFLELLNLEIQDYDDYYSYLQNIYDEDIIQD